MTDGQSFYLVLSIFYLIECIKLAPPESEALICRVGRFGNATLRKPFMVAWGMKKTVFLGPILPWPYRMYFLSPQRVTARPERQLTRVANVRRHQRLLEKCVPKLQLLAILNFLNFFVLIPLVYVKTYQEQPILISLAFAYAILLVTALHYRALHKRLLPSHKAERFKTTLYTALLPWHAPRCVDELALGSSLRWAPLAALAANASNLKVLAHLQRLWREAHYQPHPEYSLQQLEDATRQAQLDTENWLKTPPDLSAPKFCPVCLSEFEEIAETCEDCRGTTLRRLR
ncbi:hypothetical protein [Pelagicoccus albus]|uniref:Uncharacterized protein n=1 Tax=Pelagicoccus albus TaxID=415222 RepID=A0A7X1B2R8_9BACT|nr:hypothetical protein [Pelagicoccus albus]MBC2604586.1 hypothetical protein [Pelagicoccus albus]